MGEELDVFRKRAVTSAVGILEKAQNQQRWKDAFENGQYKQLRSVDCWSWQRPMFLGPALLVTCHRRQKQNPFDHKCELRKSKMFGTAVQSAFCLHTFGQCHC